MPLNLRVEDGQFSKLILSAPVFYFRGDSVANPIDISAAEPNDEVYWKKCKLPEFLNGTTKGFTWIYDGSSALDFAPSYTLVAIENVRLTFYDSRVWVDKNHNFDFTDDGDFFTITKEHGIEVPLGSNANGYHVFLERFPHGKFNSLKRMNDSTIVKLKGNRIFHGTEYSLREKRLNVIASKWTNGVDSFCIGVKDVNCNGIYDDENLDAVMITSYNGVFDNLQSVKLDDKGMAYLEWHNAAYTIKKVNSQGAFLEVRRDTVSKLKYSLNKGDKIPRFKYCTATKPAKHKSIRKLKGNYVFVYVWRDGEETFIQDSVSWHALGRQKRKDLVVLGLNYGASARYVYQYNNYYATAIKQGYSSNDINRKLLIRQIPTGILLDKKQRIVAVGITPAQAIAMLEGKN
ncbi:MAG: hypothetical protein KG003_03735 [Bacteroidetes bacterium]|nr:hypothetical protein [Bacteroidota bacterium]